MSGRKVSPELKLRPSLSERAEVVARHGVEPVSPELTLRPSLSAVGEIGEDVR